MSDLVPRTPFHAWLRLSLTEGLGPASARRLAEALGGAQAVFTAGPDALRSQVGEALARRLAVPDAASRSREETVLAWLEQAGHAALCLDDPAYPARLRHVADAPPILYVRGEPAMLGRPALAIVGARHATAAGRETAHAFAAALAARGWCVLSGLAAGIDAAAHEGALAGAAGGTAAILGTGVDLVYPARHRRLAERLIEAGGALASELPLGAPPRAEHFPRRNRLVAGIAVGVLVVEAARHSGSLITARLAAEAGREVFAIPGSIHAPLARGCHALIRQGAKLVESVDDILDELPPGCAPDGPAAQAALLQGTGCPGTEGPDAGHQAGQLAAAGSTPAQRTAEGRAGRRPATAPLPGASGPTGLPAPAGPVLAALGHDPAGADDLVRRTGLPAAQVQAGLSLLEVAGRVARMDGGRYQRLAGG